MSKHQILLLLYQKRLSIGLREAEVSTPFHDGIGEPPYYDYGRHSPFASETRFFYNTIYESGG